MAAVGFPLRAGLARVGVPAPLSLMALGVLVGPSLLNLLPGAYLEIRPDVSRATLVVLLLRAGLGVSPAVVRRIAVPALIFGTLPLAVECATLTLLGRGLVFDSWRVALLAGFMIAAISPAVVIPAMQTQKEAGVAPATALPDRIMGAALIEIMVAQTGVLTMIEITRYWSPWSDALRHVYLFPPSLLAGAALGAGIGLLFPVHLLLGDARSETELGTRGRVSCIVLLFAAGLGVYFGATWLGIESVFAVLGFGMLLRSRVDWWEHALRDGWRQLWSFAEIALYVTLGSQIHVDQLRNGWIVAVLCGIVLVGLAGRTATARGLVQYSHLPRRQRRHLVRSQIPKATLQAVFGALPLQVYLEAGRKPLYHDGATLLILSVVAIVLTAPVGAWLIERGGRRLLAAEQAGEEEA